MPFFLLFALIREPTIMGRGRGVGDCASFNRPYQVLIMGIKAPYPPPPTPPLRVPMTQRIRAKGQYWETSWGFGDAKL